MKRKLNTAIAIILVTTSFIGCSETQEISDIPITPTTTPVVEDIGDEVITQDDAIVEDIPLENEISEEELPSIENDTNDIEIESVSTTDTNSTTASNSDTSNDTPLTLAPSEGTTTLANSTVDYNLHIKTTDGTVLEGASVAICMNETSLQSNDYLMLNESITHSIAGDGVTVFSVPNRALNSDDNFMLTFLIDLGKPFSISTEANEFVPSVNGVIYAHSTDLGFDIDDKDLYITIKDESPSTSSNNTFNTTSNVDYNLHIKTSDGSVIDNATASIGMSKIKSNLPVPAIGDPLDAGVFTKHTITSAEVTTFSVADMRTISTYDYELSFIINLGKPFSISTETNDFIASVDGEIHTTSTELGFDIDDKDFNITITLH